MIGTQRRGAASRGIDTFAEHAPTWLAQMPALVRPDHWPSCSKRERCNAGAHAAGVGGGARCAECRRTGDHRVRRPAMDGSVDRRVHRIPRKSARAGATAPDRYYRTAEVTRSHPLTRVMRRSSSPDARHLPSPSTPLASTRWVSISRSAFRARLPTHADSPPVDRRQPALHHHPGGRSRGQRPPARAQWSVGALDQRGRRRCQAARSIRRLIDTQIDRLPALEQRISRSAIAVAGATFTAGVVAHALDAEVDSVDSACESLANERRFLQYVGAETWPDGTIQSRYAPGALLVPARAVRLEVRPRTSGRTTARSPSGSNQQYVTERSTRIFFSYALLFGQFGLKDGMRQQFKQNWR